MANKVEKSKPGYTEGAEFRFLGNLFGALMASAGLLAGIMVQERSFDYWLEDIVSLALLAITMRGMIKSALDLAGDSIFYEDQKKQVLEALAKHDEMNEKMANEFDTQMPRLTAKPKYSEEEVLNAVSQRIAQKREDAVKKNKLVN